MFAPSMSVVAGEHYSEIFDLYDSKKIDYEQAIIASNFKYVSGLSDARVLEYMGIFVVPNVYLTSEQKEEVLQDEHSVPSSVVYSV